MNDLWIELREGRLPSEQVLAFVRVDPCMGGIVIFEGVTRSEFRIDNAGSPLLYLHYESYRSMAVRQLTRMAEDAKGRWSLGRIAILHRLGRVAPGETSVIVAVASRHRAEAFAACRWLMDTLKTEVPIWKKDVYADGFEQWVESAESEKCRTNLTHDEKGE
jgi:molybdopterin synthase catalytic subunit